MGGARHGIFTQCAAAANAASRVIPKHSKSLPLHLENTQVNRWDAFRGFFFAEPVYSPPQKLSRDCFAWLAMPREALLSLRGALGAVAISASMSQSGKASWNSRLLAGTSINRRDAPKGLPEPFQNGMLSTQERGDP